MIKLKGGAGFAVGLSIREVVHAVALDSEANPAGLVPGQRPLRHPRRLHSRSPPWSAARASKASSRSSSGPRKSRRLQHSAQVLRETIDAVYKSNPKAAGKAKAGSSGRQPRRKSRRTAPTSRPVRVTMGAGGGNGTPSGSRVTISGQGKGADTMEKSLDRKLAAIHADPNCREFIIADAKDADMALGLGAPGSSPEMHAGEVRFKTLEEYRDQMRLITRSGLVDIMLMSASSNHALTFRERLFDNSPVTPAVRANDTTDIHLARGASYAASPRGRSAPPASTTSSADTSIALPTSARSGPTWACTA